jgi:hypothetical protein
VVGRAWICQLYDLECCLGSHTLKWPVGVVFIATNQIVAVGEGSWRWAHRTVRCATGQCPVRRHVILRLGLGAGRPLEALSSCRHAAPDSPLLHRTVQCPLWPICSDFCRVHCAELSMSESTVARRWPLLRWLTGQSGGTPNSPMNYSEGAPGKPEGEEFEVDPPWGTGHCPVAHRTVRCARPGSTSVSFAPFFLDPF